MNVITEQGQSQLCNCSAWSLRCCAFENKSVLYLLSIILLSYCSTSSSPLSAMGPGGLGRETISRMFFSDSLKVQAENHAAAKGVWQNEWHKSDELSDKSIRRSDQKVNPLPPPPKSDPTPFVADLLRHPERQLSRTNRRGGLKGGVFPDLGSSVRFVLVRSICPRFLCPFRDFHDSSFFCLFLVCLLRGPTRKLKRGPGT